MLTGVSNLLTGSDAHQLRRRARPIQKAAITVVVQMYKWRPRHPILTCFKHSPLPIFQDLPTSLQEGVGQIATDGERKFEATPNVSSGMEHNFVNDTPDAEAARATEAWRKMLAVAHIWDEYRR